MINHPDLLSRTVFVGLPLLVLTVVLAACGNSPAPTPSAPATLSNIDTDPAPVTTDAPTPETTTVNLVAAQVDQAVANDGTPLALMTIYPDAYALVLDDCQTMDAQASEQGGAGHWLALHLASASSPGEAAALNVGVPLVCPSHTPDLQYLAGDVVVYTITGGHSTDITYIAPGSFQTSQITDRTALPWSKSFTLVSDSESTAYELSAQNAAGGTIGCSITVDGSVVASNSSSGEYAVVECSASGS